MEKHTIPKVTLMLLLLNCIVISLNAQTYTGDLILATQAEVGDFNYTEVSGDLTISGEDITSLNSLVTLSIIDGNLIIESNSLLTSLNGLQNITSLNGNLVIKDNSLLTNLDEFQSISSVNGYLKIIGNEVLEDLDGLGSISFVDGSLEINSNDEITNLDGLGAISTVNGYLKIYSNDGLTSLIGLQKITSVDGSLYIYNNDALTNLEGLHNIESVESFLKIETNDAITSLDGLQNITSVGSYLKIFNNKMLTNIDGMQNLIFVDGDVDVNNNDELTSFCGLFPLLKDGVYSGIYSVYDNAVNPTEQEIIENGSCDEEITEPGIILSIGTPEVVLEEDLSQSCGICNVPVTVKDFTDVGNVSLKLAYNEEALVYAGVTIHSELINPVYKEDEGVFSMTYSGDGISLVEDAVLFTLHFTVDPNINGTPFNLDWSIIPGDCEFAGPGGESVYNGTFEDLSTTVITDELPEIMCLDNITVENDAGICGAVVNYVAPVGTDNCPDHVTIQIAGFGSGETFPVGETINTFLVSDSQGNTAECSFKVTVTDTEAPVFSDCPENIVVSTGEGRTSCDQLVTWAPPTEDDNCEVLSLTSNFDPEDIFPVGTITVTYTATDNATIGNVTTCSFTVTVIDDTAPEIICLENQTRGTDVPDCEYTVVGTEFDPLALNDNCGITKQFYTLSGATEVGPIEATTLDGLVFSKGVTIITWMVTDAAGNDSEGSLNVTIVDDDAPVINCLEDQTRGTNDPACDYTIVGNEFDPLAVNDNCEISEMSYELTGATSTDTEIGSTLDGVAFNKGLTVVKWIVKDIAGNTSDCVFNVIVVDDDVPIITSCAPEQSAIVSDGCSVEMPGFASTATAADNCELVTVTQSPEIGEWLNYDDNPHAVTITATDEAGNISTCTTFFTVLKATLGGTMVYNNVEQSPMNNVTLAISPFGENETTITDDDGNYLFTGLCAGTYRISVSENAKPVGYINATDAGAVNKWGTAGGEIEYVNFLAGDVAENNLYFNSTDAFRIQKYFVEDLSFDKAPWSYWAKGVFIGSNADNKHADFDVEVGGSNLADFNLYALCTGDYNGSFTPDPLKSAVSFLTLHSENHLSLSKNKEFDLPLSADTEMEVGAVSMILDVPSEFVKVLDIHVNGSEVPANWAINDNELRIGWHSVTPVSVSTNEHLVTLKLKTTEAFIADQSLDIQLKNSPLNELADGNFEVIQGARLKVATLINGVVEADGEVEIDGLSFRNYPNPFNSTTTLQYTIPFNGKVTINVYNSLGQLVNSLVDANQELGQYSISNYGDDLQPGVYIANLRLFSPYSSITKSIRLQVLK